MVGAILSNQIAVLFLIISIGHAVGKITIRGISAGSSAVLFVALLFGYFGRTVPVEIADLGVVLFVYSIGLQAGPRFFSTFRKRGTSFAQIGLVTILAAAVVTWVTSTGFGVPAPLAVGMFAGALTSTPGLAAALDTLSDPLVPVGYGVAYPFGVVGVVLFVQLAPTLFPPRGDGAGGPASQEGHNTRFHIPAKKYLVENPRCNGKTLLDLSLHRMTRANISRILRGSTVFSARPETALHLGDVVLAVGAPEELAKLEWIIGPESHAEIPDSHEVIAKDAYVSENRAAGKAISELQVNERFGVVISRVLREEIELVPTGNLKLEIGDLIRVVGSQKDCEAFVAFVGQREKRVHETTILPFAVGIVLGVTLAYLPIPLPGGASITLGLAGGPLFVGLLLGHFGGIGRMRLHTPYAVRYLLRELGLVFFLAGAGTKAGAGLVDVLLEHGVSLLAAGALVTSVPLGLSFILSRSLYRLDFPSSLGATCGGMTSTPGLGAACTAVDSDEPALAYAAVYPVSLIVVTVTAQILSSLL